MTLGINEEESQEITKKYIKILEKSPTITKSTTATKV